MLCMPCGKEISDESVFCQYCGKKLGTSKVDAEIPKGWEYLTFMLHFRPEEAGWVAHEAYPAPVAQQYFWNDSVTILDELRIIMTDSGWQPIGEHRSASIKLESYKSAEGNNPVAEALGAVASIFGGFATPMIPERSGLIGVNGSFGHRYL